MTDTKTLIIIILVFSILIFLETTFLTVMNLRKRKFVRALATKAGLERITE